MLLTNPSCASSKLLTLVTRRPRTGSSRGCIARAAPGSGMVFTDFRPYSEGDDIRNIDWGIYLRWTG